MKRIIIAAVFACASLNTNVSAQTLPLEAGEPVAPHLDSRTLESCLNKAAAAEPNRWGHNAALDDGGVECSIATHSALYNTRAHVEVNVSATNNNITTSFTTKLPLCAELIAFSPGDTNIRVTDSNGNRLYSNSLDTNSILRNVQINQIDDLSSILNMSGSFGITAEILDRILPQTYPRLEGEAHKEEIMIMGNFRSISVRIANSEE